ncbi:MAG: response regulator [Schwartzia sp.]|nr:response regulator [Schwartzia sp. (in: firmicutes)]
MEDKKPVILAVDDVETNLMLLEEILKEDFEVHTARYGPEALLWLASNPCNLVLIDYRMPGMTGIEVLKIMKADAELERIPVILLTADMATETEGFQAGAADFIHKPFMPEAILLRVKRILEYEYLRANLEKEVRRQTQIAEKRRLSTERLFDQTVFALAQAIDAKDKYTHGHSRRVAEYARQISRLMGADMEEQRHVFQMGLLHDVGKIGISESIIGKPDRLTDEEYAIIKSHTTIGSDILRCIEEFPDLAIGARFHHERYDGKGYPDGLAGEDIPRTARIIAVADAYDAMTSMRSYRAILPQQRVYEEIQKGRGTQFDPELADIMLRMIETDRRYTMREPGKFDSAVPMHEP